MLIIDKMSPVWIFPAARCIVALPAAEVAVDVVVGEVLPLPAFPFLFG